MEHEPKPRRFETTNRIDLRPEGIERAANEILENREAISDLASKVQAKIDFKDQVSSDDGTNVSAEWKRLGGLIVHQHSFPKNISEALRRNGVDIYHDESVLELHIPPQTATLADMTHSMRRLYEYLNANRDLKGAPLYIYGVSYLVKSLGRLIQRYGFHTADLPNEIKKHTGAARLLEKYSGSSNEKRRKIAEKFKTEDIQLCYVSVDDFMDSMERLNP
jgi:hypothetical protein